MQFEKTRTHLGLKGVMSPSCVLSVVAID
jgi:hypothetical protein